MLAVAGLVAASVSISQAQPYYITGDFNGWNNDATFDSTNSAYQLTGGPATYTYVITNGTAGNEHQFKIIPTPGSWSTTYPGNNVVTKYDAGGSNTVYFTPGGIIDGWFPLANRVGYNDPGNLSFEIAGDFNSWSGGADYQLNSIGNGIYSNSCVVPTAGSHGFKFRTPGSWSDIYFGEDFGNNNNNASFTTTNSPQTVMFRLDLPNGRWVVGDLAPPPVTNQVVFVVDMSVQIQLGQFNPATDTAFVSGAFNGWPGTGAGALVLTNYPAYNGGSNTNIYYATNTFIGTPSSLGPEYKFTDNNTLGGYEPRTFNRSFNLLSTNGVLVLPVVFFGDTLASDYLTADTTVTFTVNMNGAQTAAGLTPAISPTVLFNGGMKLFINGNFMTGGWIKTWNPLALSGNQMTEQTPGSGIYTYTFLVPKGNPVEVHYKYGFDDGVDSVDNEAAAYQDHIRNIRTSATGTYVMPTDTYGNQHVEPSFGQLTVGSPSAGTVPLTWLGRPGVYVQTSTNLISGSWVNHYETDGTNWSNGFSSTNGLVSAANWPAGGRSQFFRLIKP